MLGQHHSRNAHNAGSALYSRSGGRLRAPSRQDLRPAGVQNIDQNEASCKNAPMFLPRSRRTTQAYSRPTQVMRRRSVAKLAPEASSAPAALMSGSAWKAVRDTRCEILQSTRHERHVLTRVVVGASATLLLACVRTAIVRYKRVSWRL